MDQTIYFAVYYSVMGYLGLGVLVSLISSFGILSKIDASVKKSSFFFRILIFPSVAVLWPVILIKALKK